MHIGLEGIILPTLHIGPVGRARMLSDSRRRLCAHYLPGTTLYLQRQE